MPSFYFVIVPNGDTQFLVKLLSALKITLSSGVRFGLVLCGLEVGEAAAVVAGVVAPV